ncbi:bifunctional ADP-dependent NAD(P)H-hydrate dehydratase/NAD(P)H-hydrate epimerase [Kribbella albertanoniae]|uniref:Bifunctional NAD(P)H-hydrate repair enzyme n=1 Tax=Kribbella albertanoniae TaxID=1266829 RepID=A0A4R4P8Q6_9ACTN|nr:NAD(P)H-hydrate dehydratase [Kribbella albertanoniae]TDC18615.1 NAD(P)H-hydrate dehydratase [Kribbella albertanoniae]
MRRAHTVEQVRTAEAELMARLPEGTLMQRAASGLAVAIGNFLGRTYGARVVLLIGSGDNGGDALYAGARLARRGAQVIAVLLSDHAHAEGLAALQAAGGRVGSTDDIPAADVVVDGIVGIGGRPGLRPEALATVTLAADHHIPIVAVDTPSGVDVDTGETPEPHVHAALTVTFGTHKVCHLVDPAASACGPVHLVDIGLDVPDAPVQSLQPDDVRTLYPVPDAHSDKYSRGVLGLIAGSMQYPGAAVIATTGALAGPLGMLRYVGPDTVANAVLAVHPEVVVGEGRVQAWAVGSGLSDETLDRELFDRVTQQQDLPVVVDAGGISALDTDRAGYIVITPHAGELSQLIDVPREEIEARRLHYARQVAADRQLVVLLKGATTVVAAPDGSAYVNPIATPWLATAGSGDVLAGLLGSLLAGGVPEFEAAAVAAYLHAAAGQLAAADGPVTAMNVAAALPEVTRQILL